MRTVIKRHSAGLCWFTARHSCAAVVILQPAAITPSVGHHSPARRESAQNHSSVWPTGSRSGARAGAVALRLLPMEQPLPARRALICSFGRFLNVALSPFSLVTMSKRTKLFLIACFAWVLASCGGPSLHALSGEDVVVAFGDSLTVGVGTHKESSYPRVLAELSGINVIGSGVSGETTSEGLARLPKVLEEHNPSLLILLEGGNDILRNKDYSQTADNLDQMIQMAQDRGTQVVLIGVPEKKLFSNSAPFYSELAEKHDLVFDAKLIGSLMRSPSKKSDSVHFNQEGYAEMAAAIYDLLSTHGAFR